MKAEKIANIIYNFTEVYDEETAKKAIAYELKLYRKMIELDSKEK